MTPRLTDELGEALRQHGDQPLDVVDPVTNVRYVLIRSDRFDKVRALLSEQPFDIEESYPLQDEVARTEGWDDPPMDAYNDYDAHRPD